ncbi:MAG: hypothetical protein R3C49_28105 [Planctomycetaceae bacterium]
MIVFFLGSLILLLMAGLTLAATAAVTALLCLTAFFAMSVLWRHRVIVAARFQNAIRFCGTSVVAAGIMLLLIRTAAVHRNQNEPAALRSAESLVSVVTADEPTPGAAEEDNTTASIGDVTASSESGVSEPDPPDVRYLILTEEQLVRLLNADSELLKDLNQLQQVYAMVPISPTGPGTLQPLFPGTLLRQALTPSAVSTLSQTVARIVANAESPGSDSTPPESSTVAEVDHEATAPSNLFAESPESSVAGTAPLPEWIDHPGVGQLVVKSRMVPASESPEDALQQPVNDALQNHIRQLARRELGGPADWEKLVRISLTANALRSSVVRTESRSEVVVAADGDHSMRQTYALIEFPEALERQAVSAIRSKVRMNRVVTLALLVGSIWLAAAFFSVACRVSQRGTLFRKLATLPVLAVLIIPCLLSALLMVARIDSGQVLVLIPNQPPVTAVVDMPVTERL